MDIENQIENQLAPRIEPTQHRQNKINQHDLRFIFTYTALFLVLIYSGLGVALEMKGGVSFYSSLLSLAVGILIPSPKRQKLIQ